MVMSFWSDFQLPYVAPSAVPVLAVGSLKGGVGKTAIVTYLSLALAKRSYKVLVVDFDFQASASFSLANLLLSQHGEGAMNALLGSSSDIFFNNNVISQAIPPFRTLTFAGANFDLANVEDSLFAEFARGKAKIDPRLLLAQKLSDTKLTGMFDIVIIDTPPRLTIAALNALCCSSHILVPSAPTHVSISGSETYVNLLTHTKKAFCPNTKAISVLPTLGLHQELRDGDKKLFETLSRNIGPTPVWSDLHIPRRQAIADNKGYNDNSIYPLFEPLADRIVALIGLKKHEADASVRRDKGSLFGWRGLS
jgi:chromosome partitioning protein